MAAASTHPPRTGVFAGCSAGVWLRGSNSQGYFKLPPRNKTLPLINTDLH
jgi:hypothetical protein